MKFNILNKLKINEQYHPAVLLIFVIVSYIFLIAHIENISYFDSLWMTLTTVLTIGYGDMVGINPKDLELITTCSRFFSTF